MRKLFAIFCCIAISFSLSAQKSDATAKVKKEKLSAHTAKVAAPNAVVVAQNAIPAEALTLHETEFNFGKITQGKPVTHVFEFVNTSNAPLVLDNVQASCGCTTPQWSKEPVAPGAKAVITVGFNAAASGNFTKPVTITYNGNNTKQIIIKGEVWQPAATPAPENASIKKLKNEN